MTIQFEYETQETLSVDYKKIINLVIEKAMEYENCPYEAEISVILTDNHAIQEINKETRGIDMPTDVLSFPLVDYKSEADFSDLEEHAEDYFNPDTGELLLGDIVISVEKVKEQALSYGHTVERELAFLTAHSMLHLFGYDHIEEKDCHVMEEKQESILTGLGIIRE